MQYRRTLPYNAVNVRPEHEPTDRHYKNTPPISFSSFLSPLNLPSLSMSCGPKLGAALPTHEKGLLPPLDTQRVFLSTNTPLLRSQGLLKVIHSRWLKLKAPCTTHDLKEGNSTHGTHLPKSQEYPKVGRIENTTATTPVVLERNGTPSPLHKNLLTTPAQSHSK